MRNAAIKAGRTCAVMVRGVNAAQEHLQEHLRERAACSQAALFQRCTAVRYRYHMYRTIRSIRGNLAAHRSARTSRAGRLRSKEQLFLVGAALPATAAESRTGQPHSRALASRQLAPEPSRSGDPPPPRAVRRQRPSTRSDRASAAGRENSLLVADQARAAVRHGLVAVTAPGIARAASLWRRVALSWPA